MCTEVTFRIPYIGSEFDAPEDRAQQAVPDFETGQLTALITLTTNGCKSSLRLVNWKREKQNELGLVSGGYLVYAVTEKLPGVPFRRKDLWNHSREGRNEIREAFKVVFKYVAKILVFLNLCSPYNKF